MAAVDANAARIFRPLWAGAAITSPTVMSRGTAGCFATNADGGLWLITATHVLCATQPVAADIIPVFQPNFRHAAERVCSGLSWRIDHNGDVLAVAMDPGMQALAAALGIGSWTTVSAPADGALVAKSGAATGVTLGIVHSSDARSLEIKPLARLPADYETTSDGDSGAAWIEVDSKRVIGIHVGELGNGRARAIRADVALDDLGLILLR